MTGSTHYADVSTVTGSTHYADVDGRVDLVACVSVECILNCKNLFPALEIQKLMFFVSTKEV